MRAHMHTAGRWFIGLALAGAFNPFKFIVYSDWAGAELPPLASSAGFAASLT